MGSSKPEKRRRDDEGDNHNGGASISERKTKKAKSGSTDDNNKSKKKDKKSKKQPFTSSKDREEPSALPELDADEAGEQALQQQQQQEDLDVDTTNGKSKNKSKKASGGGGGDVNPEEEARKKHERKEKKKAAKKAKKAQDAASATGANGEPSSTAPTNKDDQDEQGEEATATENKTQANNSGKKSRFIVFVGNLPYSATVPQIQEHFAALQPTAVRLLHEKTNPSKSRGIAFVEFAGYDHMKTCLRTMHHSTFTGTASNPRTGKTYPDERKINVELTAGGGGNTTARKDKIRAKNEKLNEERVRRIENEEKAKFQRRRDNAGKQNGGAPQDDGADEGGIHPSRRGRVPGGRK